jgi:dipeptidase E
VRLLLTSAGVKNPSIRDALVDLLGKPIADSSALCIPTAQYGHPMCGPASAWRFITGQMPLSRMNCQGAMQAGVARPNRSSGRKGR